MKYAVYVLVCLVLSLIPVGPRIQAGPAAVESVPADARALRVMSFNIRYNNPEDGVNAWPNRKDRVAGLIRFHRADLVGVQEALRGMLDELQEQLPSYAWVGVGRADGKDAGEFSAILYRKDRLELLEHDTFWLSETPQVPGSKSWDAAIERIVTWARFLDRTTGRTFYHFNTHFDHVGEQARAESARLIRRRITAIAGSSPVVLTGDLNTLEASEPYQILTRRDPDDPASVLLRDAYHASDQPHYGPTSTWNGFQAIAPDRRIDYVFANGQIRVLRHGIFSDAWEGRFPSDHLPVAADVIIE